MILTPNGYSMSSNALSKAHPFRHNFSRSFNQPKDRTGRNREPCEPRENKNGFPFAYFAYFAVCPPPPQLLQSCFHFARSPSVSAARQRWAECCKRIAVGTRLWLFGALLLFLLHGAVRRLRHSFLLLFDRAVALNLFAFGMRNGPVTARRQTRQRQGRHCHQ